MHAAFLHGGTALCLGLSDGHIAVYSLAAALDALWEWQSADGEKAVAHMPATPRSSPAVAGSARVSQGIVVELRMPASRPSNRVFAALCGGSGSSDGGAAEPEWGFDAATGHRIAPFGRQESVPELRRWLAHGDEVSTLSAVSVRLSLDAVAAACCGDALLLAMWRRVGWPAEPAAPNGGLGGGSFSRSGSRESGSRRTSRLDSGDGQGAQHFPVYLTSDSHELGSDRGSASSHARHRGSYVDHGSDGLSLSFGESRNAVTFSAAAGGGGEDGGLNALHRNRRAKRSEAEPAFAVSTERSVGSLHMGRKKDT